MATRRIEKHIVCLGGGIGTVNLIKGLHNHCENVTVVLSMADDGGSAGRLRRLYKIPPPGDLVSCMAGCLQSKNPSVASLLTYRFPGDRYAKDSDLSGHKLGNLIFAALYNTTKDLDKTIHAFQELFTIQGHFLPATEKNVSISAKTKKGEKIIGETNIDLGKGKSRIIDKIFLHPKNAKANPETLKAIKNADVLIAGPGDLYTTILPVLIVPEISIAIQQSKAQKIFVVNITNKPFETKNYTSASYVAAITKHLGLFPFNHVLVNDNHLIAIPKKYHRYAYAAVGNTDYPATLHKTDLVDESFPLYHDSQKLANAIRNLI